MPPGINTFLNVLYTGGTAFRSAIGHINSYAAAGRAAALSASSMAAANKRAHISFMEMFRVMVMFGVQLQMVNALLLPGKWLFSGIKSSIDFEHKMNLVNTVLGETRAKLQQIGEKALIMGSRMGMTQDKVTDGMYNIGQSIAGIKTDGLSKGDATLKMLNESQKLALVSNVELATATEGLNRMMTSMGFSIGNVRKVAGMLFQTINLGIINGEELNRNLGDITSSLGFLTNGMSEARKEIFTNDMLTFWASISQTIPAAEAATSISVFTQSLIKAHEQSASLMQDFKRMFGVDVSLQAFLDKTPQKYFEDLFATVDKNGPVMAYITGQTNSLTNAQMSNSEATRIQATLFGVLFGNIRALRGIMALGADGMRTFKTLATEMKNSMLAYDIAIMEMEQSTQRNLDKMKASWELFSMRVFGGANKPLGGFLGGFHSILQETMFDKDFANAGFFEKISKFMDRIAARLWWWWRSGGQQEWRSFFDMLGAETAKFLGGLLGSGGTDSIFSKMGGEAAKGFGTSFIAELKNIITSGQILNIIAGPIVRYLAFIKAFGLVGGTAAFAASEVAGGIYGAAGNMIGGKVPIPGMPDPNTGNAPLMPITKEGGSGVIGDLLGNIAMVVGGIVGGYAVKGGLGKIVTNVAANGGWWNTAKGLGSAVMGAAPAAWNFIRGASPTTVGGVPTGGTTFGGGLPGIIAKLIGGAGAVLGGLGSVIGTGASNPAAISGFNELKYPLWARQAVMSGGSGILGAITMATGMTAGVLGSALLAGTGAGIAGYSGLSWLMGKDPLKGDALTIDDFNPFSDKKKTNGPITQAMGQDGNKFISINVNFDKIADAINLADKKQLQDMTNAVAKGLSEGLRKAGMEIPIQPVGI